MTTRMWNNYISTRTALVPTRNTQNIQFPRMLVEVVVHLRDLVDEITSMLHEGYIEAKYSNDEEVAPLNPVNLALLHHYWFGATDKGTELWKARSKDSNDF